MMQYSFEESGALKNPSYDEMKELDKDTAIIAFTNGHLDDAMPYYAYIAVKPSRYQEFYQMTKNRQTMIMGEYGTILMCGTTLTPPDDVVKQMEEEYGFDGQLETKLREEVEKQRGEFTTRQDNIRVGGIISQLKGGGNTDEVKLDITQKDDDGPQAVELKNSINLNDPKDHSRVLDIVGFLKKKNSE